MIDLSARIRAASDARCGGLGLRFGPGRSILVSYSGRRGGKAMKRLWSICVAAFAALGLATGGTSMPPQKIPVAWDFVDTGLCGIPIHSVGSGTLNAPFVQAGPHPPFGLTTGPVTIEETNLLTGASVTIQAPSPARVDLGSLTLSLLGNTWGVGAGLPYARFDGAMTIDLETGFMTVNGRFAGYDLCHALAPHTVFFSPQATPPPWGLPAAPLAGVYADKLIPIIGGLQEHIHSHLDIYENGSHVTLPAGIGIVDPTGGGPGLESVFSNVGLYSPLHTHDDTGLIHVEASAPPLDMTLGQFFDVWQVRLGNGCLGSLCSGLHAWVNGVPWTDDARSIPFSADAEVVLATGPTYPDPVPSSYDFPPGA
jgi:hypothetical protein